MTGTRHDDCHRYGAIMPVVWRGMGAMR